MLNAFLFVLLLIKKSHLVILGGFLYDLTRSRTEISRLGGGRPIQLCYEAINTTDIIVAF